MKSQIANLIDEFAYFWQSHRMDDAIDACRKAIEIDPNSVGALSNLGASYWAKGEPDNALPYLLKAHEIDKENLQVIQNLATIHQDKRELDKALHYYELAIELRPRNSYYKWCKGTCLLAMGDYVRGWVFYEEGLGEKSIRGAPPDFKTTHWNGNYCNRLVMWHEQGFGDTLQFCRYAKLAKQIANKVIFLAPKPLHRILASCPYIDDVVEGINDGEYEQHISVMSMPWLMRTTLNNTPNEVPYLFTTNEDREKYKLKMNGRKVRVGLVWAGNPRKHEVKFRVIDGRRTVTLDMLKPITDIPDIEFYSLQKGGDAEAQLKEYAGDNIINFMDEVNDFADTAGIIANLDLVITVDTSVAHLVGAMGRPVWILSRYDACWRWLQNQPVSPWYPSARVFGQASPGDWAAPIQQIADLLKTARVKDEAKSV